MAELDDGHRMVELVPYIPRTRLARAWRWLAGTVVMCWDWWREPQCRPWKRRRLEHKLAAGLAKWEQEGRPLVVLPPRPPCDHLDTATMPDPFHSSGTVTVCAYCSVVLDQQPTHVPDCTNPTGGHRFPAFNMPGEPAQGGPCIHCGLPFPAEELT